MPVFYSGTYEDQTGRETIHIQNDGRLLFMTVRDVRMQGRSFDDWETLDASRPDGRGFTWNRGGLCDCRITCEIPMRIAREDSGIDLTGVLLMELFLGRPAKHGGIDREELRLTLKYSNPEGYETVSRSGSMDCFEDALLDLQKTLPSDYFMRSCFGCDLSDYWPGGAGIFGDLACFRNMPEKYRGVESKEDLLKIFDRKAEFVQETHLCSEFSRRRAGRGYRG